MPVVAAALKMLLLSLVEDALKIVVPLIGGLFILILLATQGIAIDSLATPNTRAELFRPLLVTVSIRSSGASLVEVDGRPSFPGGVPASLLLAIAQVWSGFDPTHACQGASPEARRGLLGIRPAEYQAHLATLEALLGRPPLSVERGICEPEHNTGVAAARLARLYLARQSEFIFENQTYRAALAEYERQEADYQRCQAERERLITTPGAPPSGQLPTCQRPDAALLVPPPACIERHGEANPRSPRQPDHRADWEDPETICRILRHYDEHLGYRAVWTARLSWRQLLANPIQRQPRQPGWNEPPEAPGGSAGYAIGEAVRYARAQLGKTYIFGAPVDLTNPNPRAFDCSGLVQWSYGQAGIRLPRTAEEQWRATQRLTYDQLQPGDLVFFCCDPDQPWTRVSHVGIYVGAGQMLDAPGPGRPVRIEPVWLRDFIGGGRVRLNAG